MRYKTVYILFPAFTRVYAFSTRCTYVERIGLRGLGVVPTVDIAHYEYHYLSSGACAENRAIARFQTPTTLFVYDETVHVNDDD